MTPRVRPPGRSRRWLPRTVAALAVIPLLMTSAPALAAPGPSAYPEYWFDQWGVNGLWAQGIRGSGVTVAIIDTGVQASVPEIANSVLPGTDLTGLGGDGRTDRATEEFSHGTAMASLIVAQGGNGYVTGVAPDAKILPVAIPLGETENTRPDADETPDAIRYAVDHGAKIISMSFGGEQTPGRDANPCPSATQDAVLYALTKGAILVAAGGNSGDSTSPVEEPSVCLGVLSVGAVDGKDQRASFSSVHPYLTLAAPGVEVTSLNRAGEVFVGGGTSQAAALTSGALALIWSAHPTDSNREISARLMAGLRDVGAPGRDNEYGYGVVNAGASVAATPAATTPNPAFTGADPFLKALGAADTKPSPPGPAPHIDAPVGLHRLDSPSGYSTITLASAAVAAVALIALLLLGGFGWRTRRLRRSRQPESAPRAG